MKLYRGRGFSQSGLAPSLHRRVSGTIPGNRIKLNGLFSTDVADHLCTSPIYENPFNTSYRGPANIAGSSHESKIIL